MGALKDDKQNQSASDALEIPCNGIGFTMVWRCTDAYSFRTGMRFVRAKKCHTIYMIGAWRDNVANLIIFDY